MHYLLTLPTIQLAIGLILRPTTFLTGEEPPINLTFTLSRCTVDHLHAHVYLGAN